MQSGCHIPFHTPPPVTSTPTLIVPFSTEQSHLINQAIQGLLAKAAIEEVSAQQVHKLRDSISQCLSFPKRMVAFDRFLI